MAISCYFGFIGFIGVLFAFYIYEKSNLIQDIKGAVKACKDQESFDDRSETKLISWLEGTEEELHRKSLWRLKKIKNEMWRYLDIHIQMDIDSDDN